MKTFTENVKKAQYDVFRQNNLFVIFVSLCSEVWQKTTEDTKIIIKRYQISTSLMSITYFSY